MIISSPLPFFNERKAGVDMLVLHSMAHSAAVGLQHLQQYQLSAHYVVDYDGTIYHCVDEDKRAWHAGVSFWRGIEDVNSHSVGIEVCQRSLGQSRFNKRQIAALIPLCREIIQRHHIRPEMVVGHSDIAPQRKPDPGKCFPWAELAAANIGIWFGSRFADETDGVKMLSEIGYKTDTPAAAVAAAYAFCRRFLPQRIGRLPVLKLVEHPYDELAGEKMLRDKEFLAALQNICLQYRCYGQLSAA